MRSYNQSPVYHAFTGIATGGTSDTFVWPGGSGTFKAGGTFNSAAVTLQVLNDDGAYVAVGSETTLSTNGAGNFDLAAGETLRVVATGSPTGLTASVRS